MSTIGRRTIAIGIDQAFRQVGRHWHITSQFIRAVFKRKGCQSTERGNVHETNTEEQCHVVGGMRYFGSEGGLWGGCQDVAADAEVSEDVYFVGCDDEEAEAEE